MKKTTIIEKLLCFIIIAFIAYIPLRPVIVWALEFQADKNAAFNFTAPLINSTNTSLFAVGANNTYVYINSNDNTAFAAANTNITRIDAGGIYLVQLNATEMNHDLIGVYYNGTGCLQQYFAINTKLKELSDGNAALLANINSTTNSSTYGNAAINTLLGRVNTNTTLIPGIQTSLSNGTVTLGGTQAFNTTGNIIGNVTNVTNPVSLNATIAY